jgi:flavodoxin
MKVIVVYHSFWGSCQRIAEAIAKGLGESDQDVQPVAVQDADMLDPALDFVVLGGATRWPGAPRKIRQCAAKVVAAPFTGKPFATFSTGGTVFDAKTNRQASEQLYEFLEGGGLTPLAPPFIAGIEGYKSWGRSKGTLPESEIARAEEFGRELGAKLSEIE